MKRLTIIKARNSFHQNQHAQAIAEGLGKIGVQSQTVIGINGRISKDVTTWGWRGGRELYERGHNVLVMERGYIGDRFKYTSLGWNGLNGYASFPLYENDGGKRFRSHGGFIKPWKKEGDYIVVMGQVRNDASLQGKDLTPWYLEMAQKASEMYKIPVYFRPHPDSIRRGGYSNIEGFSNIKGSLEETLEGAKFIIAFNSNSCVDAICAGVPCYAGDKGTMVYDICMKNLSDLKEPEGREERLYQISWTQWTLDEIRSGKPLKALMQ